MDPRPSAFLWGELIRLARIAQQGPAGVEYFHTDALGSVRQMTDSSGGVTLVRSYAPYGQGSYTAGAGATRYGFTGEWTDGYSGLVYLRSRWYAPGQGRFLTRDSWEGDYTRPVTLNGWTYGYSNPIRYTDPTGKDPILTCVTMFLTFAAIDGPIPAGDVAGVIACAGILGATYYSTIIAAQHAGDIGRGVETIVDQCQWTWEKLLKLPSTEPNPKPERVPFAPPLPNQPPGTPESPSTIITFRELDGDSSTDGSYYKKAETSPSQFRVDDDGVSTFEMVHLPGLKPYAIGFKVKVETPVVSGTTGPIIDIPICTATYTPERADGKKHWSINCPGSATNTILSQYAKGIGKPNIILNPVWIGTSERRLP